MDETSDATGRDPTPRRDRPLLLIDGAFVPASAGVLIGSQLAAEGVLPEPDQPRGDLLAAVRSVLAQSDASVEDLGGAVFCTGPGSFTGLRVALGIGSALAAACELPLFGVDAPRVLARAAEQSLPVWTAIPWGRLRVLLSIATEHGPDLRSGRLIPIDRLPTVDLLDGSRVVTTRGAVDFDWPEHCEPIVAEHSPLVALALLVAEDAVEPLDRSVLHPTYLVPPDAVLATAPPASPTQPLPERLEPGDLEQLVALERASFSSPWSTALLAGELDDAPDREAWGIRDPALGLIACGLARIHHDTLAILSVAVHPAGRGRGLARAIVQQLLRRGWEQGASRADLEVEVTNRRAIDLYAAAGFVPVGIRRQYYENGEDALLMSAALRRPE